MPVPHFIPPDPKRRVRSCHYFGCVLVRKIFAFQSSSLKPLGTKLCRNFFGCLSIKRKKKFMFFFLPIGTSTTEIRNLKIPKGCFLFLIVFLFMFITKLLYL